MHLKQARGWMAGIVALGLGVMASPAIGQTLVVYGSSVAKGWNDAGALTNGSFAGGYAGRWTPVLESMGWAVTNISVPGRSSSQGIDNFSSVVNLAPDAVFIGFALGNDGLTSAPRPEALLDSFGANLQRMIEQGRLSGIEPVVGLVYPHSRYALRQYDVVKQMNLRINEWDVPSVNFLGAVDNGAGQWVEALRADNAHPNTAGHEEFYLAIPPTLFEAIAAGKTNRPAFAGTTGFARLERTDDQPAPLVFEPDHEMRSYTMAFRARSTDTGTVAAVIRSTSATRVRIDFGGVGGAETVGADAYGHWWNNATNATAGAVLSGLVDTTGAATAIGLTNRSTFGRNGGAAFGGLVAPEEAYLGDFAVASVTEDYWFTQSEDGISMDLTGLEDGVAYDLRLFGTRSNTATRITEYRVTGATTQTVSVTTSGTGVGLDGYNGNNDTVALVTNIMPDAQQRINVRLRAETAAPQNFAYIGALEVAEAVNDTVMLAGTVEWRANGVAYVDAEGGEVVALLDALDGQWVDVALAYSAARDLTFFFVDGVAVAPLAGGFAPTRFVLGGAGAATNRPPSPSVLDVQDWCIYRAPWHADEALAHHEGRTQQASMEIGAPLNDASFAVAQAPENRAQSLSEVTVLATNIQAVIGIAGPADLVAVSYLGSEVALSWSDQSSTETGYVVERRSTGGATPWAVLAELPPNSIAYTDATTAEGETYDYRVSTREGSLRSEYAAIVRRTAGADGESYAEWRNRYFTPDRALYRIDFNDQPAPDYEGETWNTVSGLTATAAFALVDADGADVDGYLASVTGGFNTVRTGNGAPRDDAPDDAQETLFVVTDPAGGAHLEWTGLHPEMQYDIGFFARRGTVAAGFDYRTLLRIDGAEPYVAAHLDNAENTFQFNFVGFRPDGDRLAVGILPPDFPEGSVFAGASYLIVDAIPSRDTFLIDFNTAMIETAAGAAAWNSITNTGVASYGLVDARGDGTAGYGLSVVSGFSASRAGNGGAFSGLATAAEEVCFVGPASLVFTGLDADAVYDLTFLARRGSVAGGFNYNGDYVVTGAGAPVTNTVNGAGNLSYTYVRNITPDGSGQITFEVATGTGSGTPFPVLNVLRLVRQGAPTEEMLFAGPDQDPDGDGAVNLLEYAMNTDPTVEDAAPLWLQAGAVASGGGTISLVYDRYLLARDLSYTIETTTNLVLPAWVPAAGLTESVLSDVNGLRTMQAEHVGTNAIAYYRLRAQAMGAVQVPVVSAFAPIEAENYDAMSGIQLEPGDGAIGWFDAGDWLLYENVDFGAGARSVRLLVAKENGSGSVEIRLGAVDGAVIGVFTPTLTGGWSVYQEQETNIDFTSGVHDVYLVAVAANGVCNIDQFRFFEDAVYEPNYVLVWEDEFSGTTLDTTKWHPVQHGFVDNNELQFYTDRTNNIRVADGYLWLTAIEEEYTGTGPWMNGQYKTSDYTSGKVQGDGKVSFQYGKFEARIRMPRGLGTWPAFWMLGGNIHDIGWPRCGEIDIMEHPNVQDVITAAIHTEAYNHMIGTQRAMGYPISTYDTQFHVYGVEWTADRLSFYVDDDVFFVVTKAELGDSEAEWPFDQPFWMILNLAVGGPYGGDPAGGVYPYTMQVDWVRVYQDQPLD